MCFLYFIRGMVAGYLNTIKRSYVETNKSFHPIYVASQRGMIRLTFVPRITLRGREKVLQRVDLVSLWRD